MNSRLRSCIVIAALGLASCASPLQRAEQVARRGGLESLEIPAAGFHLQAFASPRRQIPATPGRDDLLTVFIGGDGSPWIDGGRRIAADPSPRHPLALELAAETSGAVLFLGRPCYFMLEARPHVADAPCDSNRYWTSERYSGTVVAALESAAADYAGRRGFDHLLLVGYSGGGTLAELMARDMPSVVGLITIAGNLDPDAWTRLHGYLPLTGSRNPALESPLPPQLPQWHLIGGRDTNVPYAAARRYLQRVPSDRVWLYDDFDHSCCWVREWPAILSRIRRQLHDASRTAQKPSAAPSVSESAARRTGY